ncbi:MAG: hypothetical protein KUG81_07120, partial [Gammaproteobacteria bacterium]|nr:hypothetical protein [Gammaproteobacteria bacterium]
LGSPNQNCNPIGPGVGPASANNCPTNWHDQENGGSLGLILIMENSFQNDGGCNGVQSDNDPNDSIF